MKYLLTLVVTALVLLSDTASAVEKPNIVLILGDDQAWGDYGFMGHPVIRTPNLDRLAARSLVFERGYVSSPVCRPSLATMITGLYPSQHGITANDVVGGTERAASDRPLREQFHRHPSFIRLLTDNGYLTHQSGKWWEGTFADGGFTHGMTHGDPQRGGRHGDAGLKIGREGVKPVTEFIDLAVQKDKPFFLWYAPLLPHTPHNPPKRLLEKYATNGRAGDVAKYYAMCEWFDETCGQLLDYLDQKGLTENTLVLFVCDNGWAASSTNAKDPHQKSWGDFALRSKGSPFENGIRTPILASWPERLRPLNCKEFAQSIDLFPTIMAAAGLESPANLPGINLMNAGARQQRKRVFGFTHSVHNLTVGNPDDTLQYIWCVDDEWKLIERFQGSDTTKYKVLHNWDTVPVRLYHIGRDPNELNDVAADNPEVVARLQQEIMDWRRGLTAK